MFYKFYKHYNFQTIITSKKGPLIFLNQRSFTYASMPLIYASIQLCIYTAIQPYIYISIFLCFYLSFFMFYVSTPVFIYPVSTPAMHLTVATHHPMEFANSRNCCLYKPAPPLAGCRKVACTSTP